LVCAAPEAADIASTDASKKGIRMDTPPKLMHPVTRFLPKMFPARGTNP
jgi:hypothetical protein